MLTIDGFTNLEQYDFKSSPESYSDNSTDEDFLQQLSSDLDIPLLLNAGEDEMNLLNSFFDQSPEEILSEITVPPDITTDDLKPWTNHRQDFPNLVKVESDSSSSQSSSPPPIDTDKIEPRFSYAHQIVPLIKDEIKLEPKSPCTGGRIVPQKIPVKRPIHPKSSTFQHKNNVLLISNGTPPPPPSQSQIAQPPPTKVVVLENIVPNNPAIPTTTINVNSITTTTSPVPSVVINGSNMLALNNIDPKIFKKQQRKIKNRESACLSRKKKKDYLVSLENQVKELQTENQKLKMQNLQLKERLLKYEKSMTFMTNNNNNKNNSNSSTKHMKGSLVLCMFLLVVGINIDFLKSPFISRQTKVIQESIPQLHGPRRGLLWSEDIDNNNQNDTDTFQFLSMCPAAVNQTESARLVSELERWIGKPKKVDENLPMPTATKDEKPKVIRKRKLNKKRIIAHSLESSLTAMDNAPTSNNEIKLFSAWDSKYRDFFEAINRQDDTFYVVSLSDHNMLLPALYHNKTRRPKMSLIMPSMVPTNNESSSNMTVVPLMQIDCEVLDTRLIKVQYGLIPQHLRTFENNKTESESDDVEIKKGMGPRNQRQSNKKPSYKPYFLNDDS